jgi:hypothetical protein
MSAFDAVTNSRELFFFLVEACNASFRATGHGRNIYRRIIARHRETKDLNKLLDDPGFIPLIRQTLIEWGMDQQGAELASLEEIEKTIFQHRPLLLKLYPHQLRQLADKTLEEITPRLELAFGGLKIMKSKRRIVGVSKALHFLLPDLVMPIDGTYTLPAFFWRNKFTTDPEKETADFIHIFQSTALAARRLKLTPADVSGEGWNTSIPKLIDNAIIGLSKIGAARLEEKLKTL